MKIGCQIATRNTASRVPAPDPRNGRCCRGRCYLPRTVFPFAFSAPLAVKFQPNPSDFKGDASFTVDMNLYQGWLNRVTELCEMKPWAEVGGLIQANPTKSKVKNSNKPPALHPVSRIGTKTHIFTKRSQALLCKVPKNEAKNEARKPQNEPRMKPNLCQSVEDSSPFALFASFAVRFPVKPSQAQSRHNLLKTG